MPVVKKRTQVGPLYLTKIEDGEVTLRKMTWGETLKREELLTSMSSDMSGKNGQAQRLDLAIGVEAGRLFDFQTCIVDHNLTDEKNNKLDLSNPKVFEDFDKVIGQEIADLIDKVNEGEDVTPFLSKSKTSSSESESLVKQG